MPFLTDLPDICRDAVRHLGTPVNTWPGWEKRGRSGGKPYESGRPWCVMYHHTGSSDQSLEDYHATQSDNAPVCNLDIKSDGTVVVIAAGPTNTNGKGNSMRTSKGTIPADSMNSYALGIEFYNSGNGMAWPQIQIDVGFAVICGIQRAYGMQPTDLFTHEQYAPTRKVDPATAAAVQGPWKPRSKNSSGTWNDDDLRAENSARFGGGGPTPGGDDMHPALCSRGDQQLSMFDTGKDGALMYRWYDRSISTEWSEWESLGGQLTGPPTATAWGPNRIDVMGYGIDGHIWQCAWDGQQWIWSDMGEAP